ncbi:MAG: hypothetical protein ABI460_01155 [Caldimonas sp.]
MPRWLVLLLVGIAIGVAGVLVVQERYLPPRLSADAGAKLRGDFERADAERLRLKGELDGTTKRLETALAENKGLADELVASRATAERLRDDVTAVIASLPPDPRGGAVEVRAAQFKAEGGMLAYNVALSRPRATGKPMTGVMQLVVAGASARGVESAVTLKSIDLSIGRQAIVRGSLPLPEGFRPREVTIQVLDRVAGKSLGMRVILVG